MLRKSSVGIPLVASLELIAVPEPLEALHWLHFSLVNVIGCDVFPPSHPFRRFLMVLDVLERPEARQGFICYRF